MHRDLKPENIFLAVGEAGTVVKVLDFGVAKPLLEGVPAGGPEGLVETGAGVLVGTVGYMSPEQLLGERPDLSWDIWALAVVAYECLTGSLPFPATSRDSWRHLLLAGRAASLREHLAGPPAAWQRFFDVALAADAVHRPRSASEFFRRLQEAMA